VGGSYSNYLGLIRKLRLDCPHTKCTLTVDRMHVITIPMLLTSPSFSYSNVNYNTTLLPAVCGSPLLSVWREGCSQTVLSTGEIYQSRNLVPTSHTLRHILSSE
jgi:hypothetical protein